MNSVIGSLFFTGDGSEKRTVEYLKRISMASDKLKRGYSIHDKHLYEIEFKERISVLDTLEACGYFQKNEYIGISSISEDGVSFYIAGQFMGDGFLFVPMHNINAIHTINKNNLQGLINQE